MSVLVAVVGSLLVLVVSWKQAEEISKPISDSLMEKLKFVSLPDHKSQTGFQNIVIEDLKLLREGLEDLMKPRPTLRDLRDRILKNIFCCYW